jgi:Fe-S cluster assembly iron-binding protein IscA
MLIEKELAPATINQRLAAHRLLAEHGHDSDLRIGVAKSGAAGFAAHAWVECGGAVLVGQTDSEYSLLLEWSPRP